MAFPHIKLDDFEGPLDLLLHLIDKNEMDIYDIPIALITEQYLAYIHSYPYEDMDNMSEFLVMAATLLEIKSKMLLPATSAGNPEDQIDPREELVNMLVEYKRLKQVVDIFIDKESLSGKTYFKQPEADLVEQFKDLGHQDVSEILDGITVEQLQKAFLEVLSRRELSVDKIRSGFSAIVKDRFTVEQKVETLLNVLKTKKQTSFFDTFLPTASREEITITFWAMLELIKSKKILVKQDQIFGEIMLQLIS